MYCLSFLLILLAVKERLAAKTGEQCCWFEKQYFFFLFSVCAAPPELSRMPDWVGYVPCLNQGAEMGKQIAFDIHSATIWYSPGVTFMSVHYFLEHQYLRLTGLRHSFILVLSYELQSVWLPRWISDFMTHVVLIFIRNDNYHKFFSLFG